MKKHRSAKKFAYTLHIDVSPPGRAAARLSQIARPEGAPNFTAAVATPTAASVTMDEVSESARKGAHSHPLHHAARWFRGAFEYAVFSSIIFVAIYGVLNYQTLWMNAVHYWNVSRGFVSPLNEVLEEKPAAPERLSAGAGDGPPPQEQAQQNSVVAVSALSVPPLNVEVYPPDTRLIIPRINQNVPVIGVKNESLLARDWNKLEKDIQEALRSGVIYYPGTALPGEGGNVVITGHSSYYAWDAGRFKDVFGLLHDVKLGDRMVMFFNQKKFVYEVTDIKVVLPKDVDVLKPSAQEQLTLITCTPIGTNLKRLIVTARLVTQSL